MAGAATPRSSSPAAFSGVTCGAARLASLNNTHLNKTHTITWEEFKKKQDETEACGCGSGVWQRWCGKRERKVATARALLHGRRAATTRVVLHDTRAATVRGMPQCMDQFGPYLGDVECHWYLSKSITKSTGRTGTMAV
ncbi:uncharacterized protein [Miscanthus floridulus]|uniref:uncharacterized protein isoform X1 n=1 Tax=Miscanthus floridulus TaxID=154761 RepID=UPI0034575233